MYSYKREIETTHRMGEGNVVMKAEIKTMYPQAKACLQPLETGEDKNRFSIAPGGREALMMS
jgi:hypothetical protein